MSEPVIAVDARHLKSGIGTYLKNLIPGLIESTSWKWNLIGGEYWKSFESNRVKWIPCETPIYTLKEHFEVSGLAEGASLLWSPQYNAPWFYQGPLVVTLHDLIHRMPEFTPPGFKTWVSGKIMLRSLNNALKIITVSEYSKSRLADFFPGLEKKCVVVHNGVQVVQTNEDETLIKEPYILSMGNALPHKNFNRLIQAYLKIENQTDCILVLAGPRGRSFDQIKDLANNSNKIVYLDSQNERGWSNLMRHASLYVCPSLEEGFGMPPLEAMSVGVPVAAARSSSLPEVLGDACRWFDPRNVDEMADVIMASLHGKILKEEGFKQVSKFTWEHSVKQHEAILLDCLKG